MKEASLQQIMEAVKEYHNNLPEGNEDWGVKMCYSREYHKILKEKMEMKNE